MSTFAANHSAVCPYCQYAVQGIGLIVCPSCSTEHHKECWNELGGCAVYGCSNMVEVKKADEQISYWGATEKKCPLCAETIPMAVLECPFCKATFDDVRPLTRQDVVGPSEDPTTVSYRRRAVWLLVLSVLGVTAPVALVVGAVWYHLKKHEIRAAGQTVQALIWMSWVIAVLYIVLMSLGAMLFLVRSS